MTKEELISLHGWLGTLELHVTIHGAPETVHDIQADIRRVATAIENIVNQMP